MEIRAGCGLVWDRGLLDFVCFPSSLNYRVRAKPMHTLNGEDISSRTHAHDSICVLGHCSTVISSLPYMGFTSAPLSLVRPRLGGAVTWCKSGNPRAYGSTDCRCHSCHDRRTKEPTAHARQATGELQLSARYHTIHEIYCWVTS